MTLGTLLVLAIFLVFLLLPVGLLISSTKNNILAILSVLLGLLMTLLTAYSWFESKSLLFALAYGGVGILCFVAAAKHFFVLTHKEGA